MRRKKSDEVEAGVKQRIKDAGMGESYLETKYLHIKDRLS